MNQCPPTSELVCIYTVIFLLNTGYCANKILFAKTNGIYLANSSKSIKYTNNEFECGAVCSKEMSCVSVNYKNCGLDKGRCELNDRSIEESPPEDRLVDPEFSYLGVRKPSCAQSVSSDAKNYNVTADSCKSLLMRNVSLPNGDYHLAPDNTSLPTFPVYCHMDDIPGCGGGGWTLAMKVDGSKNTFDYFSQYWSDMNTYAVQNGLEGITDTETKLASYWNTPFTQICLGMRVNATTKWIKLDYQSSSLYAILAEGNFQTTTAGRSTWKDLIQESSMGIDCIEEGFNLKFKFGALKNTLMRLGIAANQQNDCFSSCSFMGFGINQYYSMFRILLSAKTCGNFAKCDEISNGHKDIAAMGYILVQ